MITTLPPTLNAVINAASDHLGHWEAIRLLCFFVFSSLAILTFSASPISFPSLSIYQQPRTGLSTVPISASASASRSVNQSRHQEIHPRSYNTPRGAGFSSSQNRPNDFTRMALCKGRHLAVPDANRYGLALHSATSASPALVLPNAQMRGRLLDRNPLLLST